jgi:uncharacterized protein
MSRDFPDWINPWTAAQGRRTFAGTVPLKRMKRLGRLIEDVDGEAAFEATFGIDEDRRPVIGLEVSAALSLMCQASLEPYVAHVERQSTLGVIESEAEMERLAPDVDPVLADEGRLALAELVEDELILALPQVPRNPAIEPVTYRSGGAEQELAAAEEEDEKRENPFAVLKGKISSP